MPRKENFLPMVDLQERIHTLRGKRVIFDIDLADLYGVTTSRLNEQVRRNIDRFPEDFMFRLSDQEFRFLRSQYAIAKWAKRRTPPYAFTDHGAVMAANVLDSPLAIKASILVVRAFVQVREMIAQHTDLKRRLDDLEHRLAKRFTEHEEELREIRFIIARLEQPTEPKRHPIGFRKAKE